MTPKEIFKDLQLFNKYLDELENQTAMIIACSRATDTISVPAMYMLYHYVEMSLKYVLFYRDADKTVEISDHYLKSTNLHHLWSSVQGDTHCPEHRNVYKLRDLIEILDRYFDTEYVYRSGRMPSKSGNSKYLEDLFFSSRIILREYADGIETRIVKYIQYTWPPVNEDSIL